MVKHFFFYNTPNMSYVLPAPADSAKTTAAEPKMHANYIEPIYAKGTSRRIYGELYKVIDSSDVVLHVLDARDPLGTMCQSVLDFIKKEKAHKQVVLVINKCDLVPNWVTVSDPILRLLAEMLIDRRLDTFNISLPAIPPLPFTHRLTIPSEKALSSSSSDNSRNSIPTESKSPSDSSGIPMSARAASSTRSRAVKSAALLQSPARRKFVIFCLVFQVFWRIHTVFCRSGNTSI